MKVSKTIFILILVSAILFSILYKAYQYYLDQYNSLENIFPPHFDNDFKFHSTDVCQRVKAPEMFQEWKRISEQAQQLNQKYQSELLKKAAFVIDQLKKNQQIYAESQGEGQQFAYTQKQLRECANRTNYTKKELYEIQQKTDQILKEQNQKIQGIKEVKNKNEIQLNDLRKTKQSSADQIQQIVKQLQDLISQKERLRRSYRNQSQLQEHQNQLQQDIDNLIKIINEQDLIIEQLRQKVQNQESQTEQKQREFDNINTQLSDLKYLEQYFRQDDLFIREDIPIIEVLEQYTKGLQIRFENLAVLAEKEKNPEQKKRNQQAKKEVEKALQISSSSHQILSGMKFECAGDCTLGTSFKNITLLSLKEEIAIKSQRYNQIFNQKSSHELQLQTLQQALEREIQQQSIYKQKLNTLQDEQKILEKNKNLQQEIEKLTNMIDELEKKKNLLQEELENINAKEIEAQNAINLEKSLIEEFEKQKTDIEIDSQKAIYEKNLDLRKSVSDCLKQKKIYDNLILKQSKQIEQVNQIKIAIKKEVSEIELQLNQYKDTYDELDLNSNKYEQIKKQDF